MRIDNESCAAQNPAAYAQQRGHVEGLKLWIDADVLAVTKQVAETDGFAV
jgi:hypothetical protein